MTEFVRHWGFNDLPHYYDEDFTELQSLDGLFVKELCPICKAHLYHSGICLNACHLSKSSRERFFKMMGEIAKTTKEMEK
jgi:hypothetical protein